MGYTVKSENQIQNGKCFSISISIILILNTLILIVKKKSIIYLKFKFSWCPVF